MNTDMRKFSSNGRSLENEKKHIMTIWTLVEKKNNDDIVKKMNVETNRGRLVSQRRNGRKLLENIRGRVD